MSQILDRLSATFQRLRSSTPDGVLVAGDLAEYSSVDRTRRKYFDFLVENVAYDLKNRMSDKDGADPEVDMVISIVDLHKNEAPLRALHSSFGKAADDVLPPDEREKLACIIKAAIYRDFSHQQEIDKDDGWARY